MLEPAPWADYEPHSSWSNKAAILIKFPLFSVSIIDKISKIILKITKERWEKII